MPKRLFALLTASLVLSALAAGCGQAGQRDGSRALPGSPLTKQEFIGRADAICERMVADGQAQVQAVQADPSDKAVGDTSVARLIALQARAIRELRALEPPPGDAPKVRPVLLHLDRLQAAMRALTDGKGEDALPAVAAIAVEGDAVARAAKRYGLFRRCGAYRESPEIRRLLRGEDEPRLRRPNGKPLKPLGPPRATRAPAVSQATEIRRLGAGLVPPRRWVLGRRFCGGGDFEPLPTCLILELAPQDKHLASRLAEFERLVVRNGWKHARRVDGERSAAVLILFRDEYNATVTLASPKCRGRTQTSDGPRFTLSAQRCLDRIVVLRSP